MKPTAKLLLALSMTFFAAFALSATAAAQSTQTAPPPAGMPAHFHPAPVNLKVLPKNLTGEQVHEIMEKWAGSLGVHCDTCHAADPTKIGPNGRPQLNFPDDSRPQKETARLMVRMTEDINANYVSMVKESGVPVTCGTCHRGRLDPPPFVIPEEHHGPQPGSAAAPPAPPQGK